MKFRIVIVWCWICLGLASNTSAQVPPVPTSAPGSLIQQDSYIRSDNLGITFISSIDNLNNPERYRNALILGAGWNRWPLYWDRVETAPNEWDWSAYDRLVEADLRQQLNINAILLGRPTFRQDGESIQGIWEPIFASGSDVPREGVLLNPDNPWAQYVFEVVNRYKPGGTLAQERNFRAGQGIRVWEVWNEPDFPQFWQASVGTYTRLLKTAYIVIKMVDPSATVVLGGLLYANDELFLYRVLDNIQQDGLREEYNWFMDVVAFHSYDDPYRSAWLALVVRQSLHASEIDKPIWMNETGVSIWNDYPGPVWATEPELRLRLATAEQQAHYFIMSAVYGWAEGIEKVFFHQLYDDCGNQPAGTDFPPNSGEICGNGACFGDAFGIYRNPSDAVCYSQHPLSNTPRPVAKAYRLLAEVFGREEFTDGAINLVDDKVTVISFNRPRTRERILVMWNVITEPVTHSVDATGESATLYRMDSTQSISPSQYGAYIFNLKPASDYSYPDLGDGRSAIIGGEPIILVESNLDNVELASNTDEDVFRPTVVPTIGSVLVAPIRPTVAPENDSTPPIPKMEDLSASSSPIFTVKWSADDNGEIAKYFVWVRIDGGEWLPWLETTSAQGDYAGETGKFYEFAVWAQDVAGNWSTNTELQPMTSTRVEQ